jgi:Transglutaminase-like superfamily
MAVDHHGKSESAGRNASLHDRSAATIETARRVRLAIEVLGVYVHVRCLVLRYGAVPAVPVIRGGLHEPADPRVDSLRVQRGLRLGRAVVKVLRLLPTDSRCLMQSLVLTAMLARRGVYSRLVIGVRTDPIFAAHAWVEVDGEPLLFTDQSVYQRLTEV